MVEYFKVRRPCRPRSIALSMKRARDWWNRFVSNWTLFEHSRAIASPYPRHINLLHLIPPRSQKRSLNTTNQPPKLPRDNSTFKMQAFRTVLPRAASIRAFSTTAPRPLAKMQIIGRLADAPETSPTSTGQEITRFAVGVGSGPRDESTGRQQHVSWFRVASFVEEGPQRRLLCGLPKG